MLSLERGGVDQYAGIFSLLTFVLKDSTFKIFFCFGIALSILGGIFEVFFIYCVSTIISGGTETLPSILSIHAFSPETAFFVLVLLATGLRFCLHSMSGYVGYLAACFLGKSGLELLSSAEYQTVLAIGKVAGTNNLVNRINIFCNGFLVHLLIFIQSLASVSLILFYLLSEEVIEVSVYLLVFPIVICVVWIGTTKLTKGLSTRISGANFKAASNVVSYFENYAAVKTYRLSKVVGKTFSDDFRALRFYQLLIQVASVSPKLVLEGVGLIIFGAVALNQASHLSNNYGDAYNATLMLAIAVFRAAPVIGNIVGAFVQVGTSVADIDRLALFFQDISPKKATDIPLAGGRLVFDDVPALSSPVALAEQTTALEFNGVWFKYRTSSNPIIKNLSFSIQKGDFVGIKGASGSGKSTVVHLICGLLKPTAGVITFPKSRSSNESFTAVNVAIVEQNVVLFPRSLLFNITLKDAPSFEDSVRVKTILNNVGLASFATDDNLHVKLGDGGRQVSGGQRQRIGLARALFSEADLVVLDEFTSSLDSNSEQTCVEALENLKGRITAVIVSHGDAPLRVCSNVIEL